MAHFWQCAQFWHCEYFSHGAWCWHGASADTEVAQGRAAAEAALAEAGGWIMRITMTMSAAGPAMIEARRTNRGVEGASGLGVHDAYVLNGE
jgi:hypothetical protein